MAAHFQYLPKPLFSRRLSFLRTLSFSGLVADGCGVGGVSFGGVEGRRK